MRYTEAARAGARQLAPLPGALAALGQALLLRTRLAAELRDHCRFACLYLGFRVCVDRARWQRSRRCCCVRAWPPSYANSA